MKTIIVTLLIVSTLVCVTIPFAAAADISENVEPVVQEEEVQPRAEVTEWRYRVYEGRYQMRLWSVTYGRWLTDWIDV